MAISSLVLNVPIHEVPEGFLPPSLRQAHGDTPLCLLSIALTSKYFVEGAWGGPAALPKTLPTLALYAALSNCARPEAAEAGERTKSCEHTGLLLPAMQPISSHPEFCKSSIGIVKCSAEQVGLEVQPHKWVIERTIAWINRCRRWCDR